MDQLAEFAQTLTELVRQHVPAGDLPPALPSAAVLLVLGVGTCVLGAKLARWSILVFFAAGGLVAGLGIASQFDASPLLSASLGAALGGCVGFFLYRLWVGLFTATFLATVAFTILSTQMVLPHLLEFDKADRATPCTEFHPGPSAAEASSGWDGLEKYAQRFGDYLLQREPEIKKYTVICVLGAGVLGLLMGVILCRMTLILFTAALGISLIGSGLALVGTYVHVDVGQVCQQRPGMAALALAILFLASVVLQTVLTRPERKVIKLVQP